MKAGTLTAGLVLAMVMACAPPEADAPEATIDGTQTTTAETDLQWTDIEDLPSGAQVAVLSGNPAEAGAFTARLRFPDDYRMPVHTHPAAETVTVVSGLAHMGRGETFDLSGDVTELRAGQSIDIAAGAPHFLHFVGETVIEVRSTGPFQVTYVNPAEDPRGR
jgi:quercetin dioxygenase-like cupin family protein